MPFNEINVSVDKIYLKVKFKILSYFDCFENITLQFKIIVQCEHFVFICFQVAFL